jgi:lipopolysaccharide transport protein LptA
MAPCLLGNFGACVIALAVALAGGAQEADREKQELELESATLDFNGQTNLFEVTAPRIRQGDLYIAADSAVGSSIEFDESSEWRFTGNVRIEVGTAVMEADSAVFTFANEQLASGELEGTPTSFSDVDASTQTSVTGRAQKMSYDNVERVLRMTGDVRMQKDRVEMQGCDIIYDFAAERVTSGSSDCSDRFRVRVLPEPDEQAAAPASPQ